MYYMYATKIIPILAPNIFSLARYNKKAADSMAFATN